MKTLKLAGILASVLLRSTAFPQGATLSATQLDLNQALQKEDQIVSDAHDAALQDSDATVDTVIASAPASLLQAPKSVLLSRRASAVCVWLLYNRETARATKLAQRAVTALGNMPVEAGSLDQFERLYWEAWLRAEVLNDKTAALKLIAAAEPLKPSDPRIAWSKKIWGAGS